jgi:hypothetical protein
MYYTYPAVPKQAYTAAGNTRYVPRAGSRYSSKKLAYHFAPPCKAKAFFQKFYPALLVLLVEGLRPFFFRTTPALL